MEGWSFVFDAPVGERILKRYWGVTSFEDFWFDREANKWIPSAELDGQRSVGNWDHRPRTFKAFKRYLRKHPELRQMKEVVFGSLFVGHDIRALPSPQQQEMK